MSSGSFATVSSEQNTVHYAMPHRPTVSLSANNSFNSEHSHNSRVPGIHYPTVSIPQPPSQQSPSSCRSLPRQTAYSVSQLQYDNMKHRCKMMDMENQRLMRTQSDVVVDANRRVEMHINEIRMIKEENRKLTQANKELRDLCCFLDDDRQKARRLAREWQKFGRYTSHVMKQEIHSYQQRQTELEKRGNETTRENDELRQLCLYLDEQRQTLMQRQEEEESEDLGCGSSERSSESDQFKTTSDATGYNMQKENALRMISEQMQTSVTSCGDQTTDQTRGTEKLLNYIQSLESRIKHLEVAQNQGEDSFWTSASNLASDSDEKTVIERWEEDDVINREKKNMIISTTSTMTSSGTTYGSSETDVESAVYVMGDEIDAIGNLEVRTLPNIEEEKECDHGERPDDEGVLPPPCAPLSASLLSVGRLSMSSERDFGCSPIFDGLARSASVTHSPATKPLPAPRATSVEKSAIADAVKVLRVHERAQKNERAEMSRDESAIVQHMCQV